MRAFTGLLLILYGFSRAIAALEDAPATEAPCRARVWVRAPDLEPGQVIQGHVKVKLDGSCKDVSSYSLGLRFAERSWVKTRREGAKLPERPAEKHLGPIPGFPSNDSVYEPGILSWRPWQGSSTNHSVWEQYESDMKDPVLWLVREEERIGFETRYILCNGEPLNHDLIQSFAILVPSTNYPPALDMSTGFSIGHEADAADTEHIYAYFLDVTFENGTQLQIPGGYTSFNAVTTAEIPVLEKVNVTMTRSSQCPEGRICEPDDPSPRDEFTLEVTFPHGRHFEQGSVNNITIISFQLGPGLQRPLGLKTLNTHVEQKCGWAMKIAADNKSAEMLLHDDLMRSFKLQLRPISDDELVWRRIHDNFGNVIKYPRFSQDGVVENGTAFATEAVTARFNVPQDCYPAFEMYYQTTEVALEIKLEVRNVSSPDALTPEGREEYDWTPKKEESYRSAETLHASIPIFVHRKPEDRARLVNRATSHYLSPEARAPIFMDPSSITQLLRKTVEERDDLAPISQATLVKPADGNIVKNRYYGREAWRGSPTAPYYVGDTWLRKVVERGESKDATEQAGNSVIQA